MDDARRLTAQGEERKRQLLDCAARLFSERGYTSTRVIDIVRAAGVAKGLFYWYFDNKEEVFAELVADVRERLRRAQQDAMDPLGDPLVRLRQAAEVSLRFINDHAHLYAALQLDAVDDDLAERLRAGNQVYVDDTAAVIREGIELGLIRDEDPDLLAHAAIALVVSFSQYHRVGRLQLTIDELVSFVGRQVVWSLAASDAAALAATREPAAVPALGD